MAHIEKRRTSRGEVRYRAQITLKGHPRVSETFSTRREATRWAERTTEAIRQRRYQPESEAEHHTVGDLIDRYLEVKVPALARPEPTARVLEWWRLALGEHTPLIQLTPAAVARARDKLTSRGLSGKRLSPATVKRYLTIISSALSAATKEWFWMEDNPCRKVVLPPQPRGRVRFLDEEEKHRLLATCKASSDARLYPLVVLALCTGARRGELLSLTWKDIDLDRDVAVIHHSKNGERRALVLSGLAKQILSERVRLRRVGSDLVFSRRTHGAPFPYYAWDRARETAGIEDFRFHDLRHTFASYLAMSGATLAELAEALGHKTLSMVKRYAHLTEGHTMNVVSRMTERFMAA